MLAWFAAPIAAASMLVALYVHTRVRGFLPDDVPRSGRKRHERPTPMAGLVPAALAAGVAAWWEAHWLAAATVVAAVVGAVDDFEKERGDGLPWRPKALGLAIATALVVAHIAAQRALSPGAAVVIGAAVFALINATNFLDNTDGVATAAGATGLLLAGAADESLATALGAAWLGFLPFNWPRPRAFLGDSGAFALGACLAGVAATAALSEDGIDVRQGLAPTLVFALDFVQVVAVRLVLGYAPWIGDRRHLTHVLSNVGVGRVWIAPLFAAGAAAGFLVLA